MTHAHHWSCDDPDARELLPVVVGAHPRAELDDRPLADALATRIQAWIDEHDAEPLRPLVCTDLWYLNDADLRARPTIALGGPEVNAATAYLANRLPTAFVVDDRYRVHLDQELIELKACLWGTTALATAAAADLFAERYLDRFLRGSLGLPV